MRRRKRDRAGLIRQLERTEYQLRAAQAEALHLRGQLDQLRPWAHTGAALTIANRGLDASAVHLLAAIGDGTYGDHNDH
jgi:hypothetical protein